MKFRKYHIMEAMACLGAAVALTACDPIDDDLSDCGAEVTLLYRMQLITNMDEEIDSVLCEPEDQAVATALRQTMRGIFSDRGYDLDLSFYDYLKDEALTQHEEHNMGGDTERQLTVTLKKGDYRHAAVANFEGNGVAQWTATDRRTTASLLNPQTDTIQSHRTGIFTGRHNVTVNDINKRLSGRVDLFMANDAVALVIDTTGVAHQGIHAYIAGLADGFMPADSSYTFQRRQLVATQELTATGGKEMCLYGVGFPSPDSPTRAGDEPYYWRMRVYVTLPDGTVTENVLSITQPLKAARLKVIKMRLKPDGELETVNVEVGVSVSLNWKPGMHFES